MKNPETKTNIEIEGAILTDEILITIKELQHLDNDSINVHQRFITNTIFFIAGIISEMDKRSDFTQAAMAISDLKGVYDMINKFRKP